MSEPQFNADAIAVIGLAARMPGAADVDAFWRNLAEGRDTISRFDREQLLAAGLDPAQLDDPAYVPAKGLLPDADCFDADYFGLSPADAALMDPQQRVFVECAHAALEHAGYGGGRGGAVGVFGGSILSMYLLSHLWPNRELMERSGAFQVAVGNDPTFLATRVAYLLDLKGPALSLGTACSTGLVAVHQACQSLLAAECDLALAGAVSIHLPLLSGYRYTTGSILSPVGDCRPFDSQAAGTVSSDGVGVVVLKRLAEALAAGDTIHAVIRGSAINNDGHDKVGFTAPAVSAQAQVIAEALELSATPAASIAMVEAHAAGTSLGDPIEVAALREVFAGCGGHCAIGSVKSNIGHVDAAAGIAGLIKAVLALSHRAIPPSLHVETVNPALQLEAAGFYVPTALTPYDGAPGTMRAGVSSFGIGGTNCHVVLQEPPPLPPDPPPRPAELLLLSAASGEALGAAAGRLADHLEASGTPPAHLAHVAHTLRVGRALHGERAAVVAASTEEAVAALRRLAAEEPAAVGDRAGGVAFMFPGLGDHYPAMGWELYCLEPAFRAQIDRCAELLAAHRSGDIRDVLFPGKEWARAAPERLEQAAQPAKLDLRAMLGRGGGAPAKGPAAVDFPRGGQPAIFVLEYALAQLLRNWGVEPTALVGYSIGEFVAACLAGVFGLADALRIVAARAELIEAEVARGGMLAVPMGEAELAALLPAELSLATVNGPRLSVVAGPPEALQGFQERMAAQGCNCQPLGATYAYHSWMMERIVPQLAAVVGAVPLSAPQIPCVSCVTGGWLSAAEATDPYYWARHLTRTVRFRDAVATLLGDAAPALAELGPGQSLCAHAKALQAQRGLSASAIVPMMRWAYSGAGEWRTLLDGMGRLWSAGAAPAVERVSARDGLRRVPLPGYPLARLRHWVEPPAAADQLIGRTPAVGRRPFQEWALLPHWRPAPVLPAELPAGEQWLVFDDGGPLGDAFCTALAAAGAALTRVGRGAAAAGLGVAPGDAAGFEALIHTLAARGPLPQRILFLWAATPADDPGVAAEQGYFSLQALCAALIRHGSFERIALQVVARGLSSVGGRRPEPAQAPLLGVLRVAAQERPGLIARVVDPGDLPPAEAARVVLQELAGAESAPLVAFADGRRWVEEYAPLPLPAAAGPFPALRADGVYLITGGLGGVGLALAGFLARQGPVRLALLGRSPLPPADQAQAWIDEHGADHPTSRRLAQVQALRAAGAQVVTLAADVADGAAMEAACARAEAELGPLTGVFHCAGAIGAETFAEIARSTRAAAEEQFRAKVHGTRVLAQVLERRNAQFCVLTSSLAAVLGGLGFGAYAAANLYLDAFAQARADRPGTRWLAIDWDAWRIGAVKAAVEGFGGTVSDYFMEPDEAAAACLHLLALPGVPRAVISTGDLGARLRQWVGGGAPQPPRPMTRHKRSARAPRFVAPETATQQRLAEIWEELFAIEPIGIHDNFFELGGHSLLATQMNARIASRLGADLSLTSVLAAPSIAQLAVVVDDARLAAVDEHAMTEMLAELDGLSDAEIADLLAGEGEP